MSHSRTARTRTSQPVRSPDLRLRAAVIAIAGVLVYVNSLSAPFLFDDQNSIVDNTQIRHLWPLTIPLSPPRDTPVAGRPIVNLTYAVNYALGGLRVEGYHIVNVGIHVLAALLLFGVVRRTLLHPGIPERLASSSTGIAWAAALIWMLHPLQTESVNYLSERTEALMGLFYLMTMYAAIRALDRRGGESWNRWDAVATVACALGMACKESMVTAPVMVVLYDRIFVFDSIGTAFRTRRSLYLGLAASWIVLAALMLTVPRSSVGFSTTTTPWIYFLNQLALIARYLRLAIWPRALVLDYGLPRTLAIPDVVGPAIVVGLAALVSAVALVRWPRVGFLGAWFFLTLAPTSSVVPIATEVGAERRMYLPLAGLVVLAVVAWKWRTAPAIAPTPAEPRPASGSKAARTAAASVPQPVWLDVVALLVVCVALAAGTITRNREYASRLEMARTIVERWPHGRGRFILGSELIAAGRRDEAMAEFRASASDYPGAHFALGTELIASGSMDTGIAELQSFIRALPSHQNVIPAREMIGRALLAQRRLEPAAEQFEAVIKLSPANADAHMLLGDVRLAQNRYADAVREYEAAMKLKPATADLLDNLGIALASSGRLEDAIGLFQRAAVVDPGNPVAPNLLGRALASRGQFAEAAEQFRRAVALDPAYGDARANLAAVEAELRSGQRAP